MILNISPPGLINYYDFSIEDLKREGGLLEKPKFNKVGGELTPVLESIDTLFAPVFETQNTVANGNDYKELEL